MRILAAKDAGSWALALSILALHAAAEEPRARIRATTVEGRAGHVREALPLDALRQLLEAAGRVRAP